MSQLHEAPAPATSFVGREAEVAACIAALSEVRLVTLAGAGGVGKTRLAIEVARQTAERCRDGAWWVDLAPVSGAASVEAAVGRALGVWLESEADPLDVLTRFISDGQMLIVLDNCEHVIDPCRELVSAVLSACDGVRFLATSREPLGSAFEALRRVPPLAVPTDAEAIGASDAGRLFVERARSVRPNFAVSSDTASDVRDICRRLDGIPLAIELAAARTRLLTPGRILAGLQEDLRVLGSADTPLARQQTLDASVAWSHRLLSDLEQLLLQRLAVFSPGFDFDAVEAVCDAPPLDRYGVLDVFDRLIDRSMVAVDDAGPDRRYRLLETVRAFARGRAAGAKDEEALRDRHLAYFVDLAGRAEPEIPRAGGLGWMRRLEEERGNLLAALEWAATRGDAKSLLRLAAALGLFWEMRGRFAEGARWLDRALAADDAAGDVSVLRVRALWARAHLAIYAGDFATGMAILPRALELADRLGDQVASGRLRNIHGFVLCYSDPPAARAVLQESIALATAAGDAWAVADSTKFLSVAYVVSGDVRGCEVAIDELRRVAGRLGNAYYLGYCDCGIGYCHLLRGQLRQAIASFDRSIAASVEVGDPATTGITQGWRAYALAQLGEYAQCRAQATECLERTIPRGGQLGAPWARIALGLADLQEGVADRAAATLREVAESSRATGDIPSLLWALPLLGRALLEARLRDKARAVLDDGLTVAGAPIDNAWTTAQLIHVDGLLAAADGDTAEAERLLQRALAIESERGFVADAVPTLHALAVLAAKADSFQEAARLFGAVDGIGREIGLVLSYRERAERLAAEGALRAAIGAMYDHAYDEGRTAALEDVAAYAARARGARGRPLHGWDSLTPTELRVIDCVTEGLTNPQIAGRLFMSRATVKTHLAHVFAKLGVDTRAELAAAAAKRATRVPPQSRW